MSRIGTLSVTTTSLLLLGLALPANDAIGQTAKDIVGTWTVVSVDNTNPDGTRVQNFGPNPQGMLTFDASGRYSLQLCRSARAKFASNNRNEGTSEENKTTVQGCNPHWGRYVVNEADRTITFRIEHAMFPNWEGTEQKRAFTITGDQLKYTVPTASTGGTAEVVWRRAN